MPFPILTATRVDRVLQITASLILIFLPLLWFAHRVPDTREQLHLTWSAVWILLPLLLLLARRIRRDVLEERGVEIPASGKGCSLLQQISLAMFMPFLLLLGADKFLAINDKSWELPPIIFETNEAEADISKERVLSDPILLFKFNPGTTYNAERINTLGYRDREVEATKAPGTKRVICFGDSITAQGRPGYSQILHGLLQETPPSAHTWEAFNMGVYGYSSRQGLAVFRLQGKALQPDVITAYFGPNDRNLYRIPDVQRMAKKASPVSGWFLENFQEKRIGQFVLHRARENALKRYRAGGTGDRVPRVPPEDYRTVMRAFINEARDIGATPILLTAPRRALDPGLVPEHADDLEAVTKRHDAYNDIVREVTRELDAPLLDLATLLEASEFDHMFSKDGVHFDHYDTEHARKPNTQPGLEFISKALHAKILEVSGNE